MTKILVITIHGGTGAGKTTLAGMLARFVESQGHAYQIINRNTAGDHDRVPEPSDHTLKTPTLIKIIDDETMNREYDSA